MHYNKLIFSAIFLLLAHHVIWGQCYANLECAKNLSKAIPICILPDYKQDIRPDIYNAQDIFIHLDIHDIIDVNDYDTTVTLALTLSISWIESRLQILRNSSAWMIGQTVPFWTKLNPQCKLPVR